MASSFVNAMDNKATFGKHYDLCGPKAYTLKELVQYTSELIGEKRVIIGLSSGLSKLQAIVFGMLPGKLFTMDNYMSLQQDAVCKEAFPKELAVTPKALETIAPSYLANQQIRGRYDGFRRAARRGA